MILDYNSNKGFRLLDIYERLNKGEHLNKQEAADKYKVSVKTIQRDLEDLRNYLSEKYYDEGDISIKYSRSKDSYFLIRNEREWLTNHEVMAMCKILLESRALCRDELYQLVDKLMFQVAPNDRKLVESIIANEKFHYIPLQHNKKLLEIIWQFSEYISGNTIIEFDYIRQDGKRNTHRVKPVALMFSEYYFYLVVFMADESKTYPTVYRIDRISNIVATDEKFRIPYKDKFSDGEFRKRVQFMYTGELCTVQFEYHGPNVEAVLDRLPTAEIVFENESYYDIRAEVYGIGIDMWLNSQGDNVRNVRRM